MSSTSVFAVPVAASQSLRLQARSPLKRKRRSRDSHKASSSPQDVSRSPSVDSAEPLEYRAVVTPAERSQRRLAGLPLDQEPPPFPFPHSRHDPQDKSEQRGRETDQGISTRPSLHSQHLAAMTAVLHRSMMSRDYVRASRALGLLLRNEIGGEAIDIRNEGLWGVGAEILFRRDSEAQDKYTLGADGGDPISRQGFDLAKLYYERLMVQYPRHKTWPDAVNALDFSIAMFGLWVYVTNQEVLRLQNRASLIEKDALLDVESDFPMLEAKQWELEQAKEIGEAMDVRMRDVPFNGDPELSRLRAMVALWTADLIEDCAELEGFSEARSNSYQSEDEGGPYSQIERMAVDSSHIVQQQSNEEEPLHHRSLARSLLAKFRDVQR